MGRCVVFVISFSLALGAGRGARACAPGVRLAGDKALVAEVTAALVERGIATDAGDCPAIAITVARKGKATVVSREAAGAPVTERAVTDVRTAATVIESWVRTDVEEPLLARARVDDDERPDAASVVVSVASRAPRRRVELFTVAETGLASDETSWLGAALGACIEVGALCVGGQARVATVADGALQWQGPLDREAVDFLASVELPLRLGRARVTPGLGVGAGWIRTHEEDARDARSTLGLRGEPHVAISLPLGAGLAAEVRLALEVTQALRTQTTGGDVLPADPRLLAHLGAGLRFGGP